MSDSGVTVLRLAPTFDLPAAEDLLRVLRKARNTVVLLEAGDVTRVSTIALQALLCAWMTWKSDGHDFHVAGVSPALADAVSLLGLPGEFLAAGGPGA